MNSSHLCQMEDLQMSETHLMEPALPLNLDNEALLHYEQALSEIRCVNEFDPTDTQPVRMEDVRWLDAETPPHVMRSMHTSDYSLHSHLQYEESLHGFDPNTFSTSEDPGRSQIPQEEQNRIPQPPSTSLNSPLNINTINPFHTPHLNHSWPVLVPHFNPYQNPFCPVYLPPRHFNPVVACGDSAFSCLVLRPHMSVYPVVPTPFLPPNMHSQPAEGSSAVFHARLSGGRFPADVLDSYGLWRRLCETAKAFSSGSPDTEALACFFIRVIRSLAVHRPDLPFTAAVNVAVEEWRKTTAFEREQYHVTARMFIELDEQNKSINRSDEAQSIPAQTDKPTGNVKKTCKRSKKAVQERPVEDLAESALMEYSQVMDAVESKVSDGSEVNAADEEDVCALYLNQMFNHCEFTTEAGFDMDYISSLLSTDHNLTDVLKEDSPDMFSSTIPEPVAGCSDWTHATVSDAQIRTSFAPQREDHMMQDVFRTPTPPALVRIQDNDDQNAFQTLTSSPQGQETIHSAFQDFVPEADGNSSGQKDETPYVAELDTTVQSDCFSLQNYKSHHATFTHAIQHPKTPANGGMEHDGEENVTENTGSTKEKRNKDTDIPNDSQRKNATKTQTNIKEKDVKRNKKQKRGCRRQTQQKIPALDERTTPKSDGRQTKTAKNQRKTPKKQQKLAIGKNGNV